MPTCIDPKFEMVTISEKEVYVITIPKMKTYPHAVKFSDCSAYYIRVGTTVRVANAEELQELFVSSGKTTINQAIQRLRETIPSHNGPYRSVLIAPEYLISDLIKLTQKSELQIMNLFNRELIIGDPKPTQNSVIFRFPNDKVVEYFATVTKEGLIFYREYINESTGEIPGSVGVHLARTINIIRRLIEFAAALYQSYNYTDVCLLEFEAGNIGNLPLIYSDYFHRSFYRFESGQVLDIKRQISRNDLKASSNLLEGILIELSRSFGLHMDEETAKKFIENLKR